MNLPSTLSKTDTLKTTSILALVTPWRSIQCELGSVESAPLEPTAKLTLFAGLTHCQRREKSMIEFGFAAPD